MDDLDLAMIIKGKAHKKLKMGKRQLNSKRAPLKRELKLPMMQFGYCRARDTTDTQTLPTFLLS